MRRQENDCRSHMHGVLVLLVVGGCRRVLWAEGDPSVATQRPWRLTAD